MMQEKSAYDRILAPCPFFGTCGGRTIQDLAYENQLKLKQERLRQAFAVLGHVPEIHLNGLEEPWRYRNKAEFTFGNVDGKLVRGFHATRSFSHVVDLDDCLLLPEPMVRLLREVRTLAAATGLPAYHPRAHQGFFRYLVVRRSDATGRMLVCLITTSARATDEATGLGDGAHQLMEGLATELVARHPDLASVYWGQTDRLADVAVPDSLILLTGDADLEERIGPFRIRLQPFSFLQSSTRQVDRMYHALCRALGRLPKAVAWA